MDIVDLRTCHLDKLATRSFDVLIVGGGINGAVCAAALSAGGATVALIDRGDFAGETSQQSSNLVWGGVKYLENYEIGLVRKLCVSRNRLIRAFPSNVREIRFLLNLERGFRKGRLFIWFGAWLYWLIGNFFTRPPKLFSTSEIAREEPKVRLDRSQGGVEYSDAYLVDNDARFVFNFVRSAIEHGTAVANYVESLGAERSKNGEWTCHARDRIDGGEFSIRARVLINAAGPWVDTHNKLIGMRTRHQQIFSRGIHLIVDRITPNERVLAFFADDGRFFFVIPMGSKSCIGTTDTRETRLPPVVRPEDRRFVLDNVNKRLKLDRPIIESDIIAERCGVRPLVALENGGYNDNTEWTALSRKHEIEVDTEKRHISIFGGKITDCLNVGDEIIEAIGELGVALPRTGQLWYGEPPVEMREDFFRQAESIQLDTMTSPQASEPLSSRLWRRYGQNAFDLLDEIRAQPTMAEVVISGTETIRAEIHHAARREMIIKLEDFLRRRSKIALRVTGTTLQQTPGLLEACRILFRDQAESRYAEYFVEKSIDIRTRGRKSQVLNHVNSK